MENINKIGKHIEVNEGIAISNLLDQLDKNEKKLEKLNVKIDEKEYQITVDEIQQIRAKLKHLGAEVENEVNVDPSFWIKHGGLN